MLILKGKDMSVFSYSHPRSRHWHQLDLVITRRVDLSSVLHTRSYHSADCDSDHSLVGSKIRLKPRKIHHARSKCRPRINTCATAEPAKAQSFAETLRRSLLTSLQPKTRTPNGLTSATLFTTRPCPLSGEKNARMLTGSRRIGMKCSQSRKPKG